jgi:hypothetical protein
MAVGLKDIGNRVALVEQYITTAQANSYIANSGTCNNTNNLGGIRAGAYNCGGTCSWSSSGGAKQVTYPS